MIQVPIGLVTWFPHALTATVSALMARPRKQPASKAVQDLSSVDASRAVSDGANGKQGKKLGVSLSSSGQNLNLARLDANVRYWQELGHHEGRRRHKARLKRTASPHADRKPVDANEQQEKYALYSNTCAKRVILLQYPERRSRALYSAEIKQKPLEIRVKPKTGVVEVDVPLDVYGHYSKDKGVEFGSALRRSNMVHRNGAHGLGGGLETGPPRQSLRSNEALMSDVPPSEALGNFDKSVSEGRVLDIFTLGGRIEPFKDGDPVYMVATFSDSVCKWTKVDAIVQLRAQFTHLDALNADKRRLSSTLAERSEDRVKEERIEDVNMIVKDTADGDNTDMYGGMNETAKLLRAMRDEPWQRLQWHDSGAEASQGVFHENFEVELPGDAPFLVANMTGGQFLDAISCARLGPVVRGTQDPASLQASSTPAPHTISGESSGEEIDEVSDTGSLSEALSFTQDRADQLASLHVKDLRPPDAGTERLIEKTCRMINLTSQKDSTKIESLFVEKFGAGPKYAFLRPDHEDHAYFRQRLNQTRSGAGIPPYHDHENFQ